MPLFKKKEEVEGRRVATPEEVERIKSDGKKSNDIFTNLLKEPQPHYKELHTKCSSVYDNFIRALNDALKKSSEYAHEFKTDEPPLFKLGKEARKKADVYEKLERTLVEEQTHRKVLLKYLSKCEKPECESWKNEFNESVEYLYWFATVLGKDWKVVDEDRFKQSKRLFDDKLPDFDEDLYNLSKCCELTPEKLEEVRLWKEYQLPLPKP